MNLDNNSEYNALFKAWQDFVNYQVLHQTDRAIWDKKLSDIEGSNVDLDKLHAFIKAYFKEKDCNLIYKKAKQFIKQADKERAERARQESIEQEASIKKAERRFDKAEYEKAKLGDNIEEVKESVINLLLKEERRQATEVIVQSFLKQNHIYTTRDDEHSEMWIYCNGIYIPEGKTYISEYCRQILNDNFTTQICNEVIAKIETDTFIEQDKLFQVGDINKVAIQNGILNLKTKEITQFNPDEIFFNKLPVIFDKTKDCPFIKKHLIGVLSSKNDLPVIQELFGYLLYRDYKIEKAFMFTGSGRNGKGKTVELMKRFLGIDNCANITLQQMEQDSFAIGELFNKMANLSPDISHETLKNTGYFKSLTGHDLQSAARKFKSRINFVNYAKMIFCANELPRTSDMNMAFFNRWILLDFPYTFLSKKEIKSLKKDQNWQKSDKIKVADIEIIEKLSTSDELSGLLNWALDGLNTLLAKGDFSYSQNTQQVKVNWIRKSDSISAFLLDFVQECYESEVTKSEFRYKYSQYCKIHKLKPVTDKIIKDVLTTTYGVSETRHLSSENQQVFYWVGIKFNEKINQLFNENEK